jgi:hypothetical protein
MGDLIRIDSVVQEKEREERARMADGLRQLAKRAEDGELLAVAFVAIPHEREGLSVGLLKTKQTGLHELVGATTILNDYLRKAVLD